MLVLAWKEGGSFEGCGGLSWQLSQPERWPQRELRSDRQRSSHNRITGATTIQVEESIRLGARSSSR